MLVVSMGLLHLFYRQWVREFRVHCRQLRTVFNACLFFLMVMAFFPLTMPLAQDLSRIILPGLLWIALLFALLLSSEGLFQHDYDEGVIEQWLISGYPVSLFIVAKLGVHWVMTLFPMVLISPVLALLFQLDFYETGMLVSSLLCGTPAILCLCALAAASGSGLKQKGVLMALILLPLTIPVMIFGSGAMGAAIQGQPVLGYLAILLAISLTAMLFLPFAIAGIVRISFVD